MTKSAALIPRPLPRGGQLPDLSQPEADALPVNGRQSVTTLHAVGSRPVRSVIATGDARATRAPIVTES
jgi:hypothetical protein